jgi:hypothetical protein
MALKFITAEEAASYVHHNDNVGFVVLHPQDARKSFPELSPGRQRKNTLKVTLFKSVCLPALLLVIS